MSRPRKCRKVCCLPENNEFIPAQLTKEDDDPVILNIDEYETIRLIDNEGFSQEQCGESMQVARTTIQQIYNSARRKIADALVNGRVLKIEGGAYQLCDGSGSYCGCNGCYRNKCTGECD